MSEPYIVQQGDPPLWFDPATRENFYVGAYGKQMRFRPDDPPKYAATCRLCAMAGVAPPRGARTSLSPDGRTLTLFAPDGGSKDWIGVDDAQRFREVCLRLRGEGR